MARCPKRGRGAPLWGSVWLPRAGVGCHDDPTQLSFERCPSPTANCHYCHLWGGQARLARIFLPSAHTDHSRAGF